MRHALISGGSSGIGLALARRLAADGYAVSIIARRPALLAEAHRAIEAARREPGQSILSCAADVTDFEALQAATDWAVAKLGPPELLVASAGVVVPGTFSEIPADEFRRCMDVNYLGTLALVRAALPSMRRAGRGRIVLISSGAGLIGLYGYTAYAPTKFAVRGLAEALRSELAPDGIGVSVVFPPDTDTPQLREELLLRPLATSRIASGAKVVSADKVAQAIMNGVQKKRFVIAPGWEMAALARFHSLIGPWLHRFWFDRVIAKFHVRPPGAS